MVGAHGAGSRMRSKPPLRKPGGDAPPVRERRILHRRMGQLVREVRGQPVPAVELPHVDHFRPSTGRTHRAPHAVAELVAFLAPDGTPVRGHVVHVLGAVGADDVDQLVDVDLGVRHHVPSPRNTTLPTSLRGSSSTTSKRTGTLYGARCSRHSLSSAARSTSVVARGGNDEAPTAPRRAARRARRPRPRRQPTATAAGPQRLLRGTPSARRD